MRKKRVIFQVFRQDVENAVEGSRALDTLVNVFTLAEDKVRNIHAIEHYGDKLTHQIIEELNGTFVTPLDREDIVGLASKLDDVTDVCWDVAEMISLYKVASIRPAAIRQVHTLVQAAS